LAAGASKKVARQANIFLTGDFFPTDGTWGDISESAIRADIRQVRTGSVAAISTFMPQTVGMLVERDATLESAILEGFFHVVGGIRRVLEVSPTLDVAMGATKRTIGVRHGRRIRRDFLSNPGGELQVFGSIPSIENSNANSTHDPPQQEKGRHATARMPPDRCAVALS